MNQFVTPMTTPPITLLITRLITSRLERPPVVADVPRLCLSPDRHCSHDRTGRDLVSGDAVGCGMAKALDSLVHQVDDLLGAPTPLFVIVPIIVTTAELWPLRGSGCRSSSD